MECRSESAGSELSQVVFVLFTPGIELLFDWRLQLIADWLRYVLLGVGGFVSMALLFSSIVYLDRNFPQLRKFYAERNKR